MSPRFLRLLLPLIVGAAFGVLYGWVLNPVEYIDIAPAVLRADYRADYVLMIAEAHRAEQDSQLAARRLAILGDEPPAQFVLGTLEYARLNSFTADELALLQGLLTAMQTYQPAAAD